MEENKSVVGYRYRTENRGGEHYGRLSKAENVRIKNKKQSETECTVEQWLRIIWMMVHKVGRK